MMFNRVPSTIYEYAVQLERELSDLRQQVNVFRTTVGRLDSSSLERVREYFRMKNIYNSNAIEGNSLSLGETQMVVREGLTITGKPLKDSTEAKNLSIALDFFDELAQRKSEPISVMDIRNIHRLVLKDIDDRNAGLFRTVQVSISGSQYPVPDPAQVESQMREFGTWLETVSKNDGFSSLDPLILACAAHVWFVIIHPFVDGNGRTARLLMNLLLVRAGYPLAIITIDDRERYYDALEEAQGGGDISQFVSLVLECVMESMAIYEEVGNVQHTLEQRMRAIALEPSIRLRGEFEIYDGASKILKGAMKQAIQKYNDLEEVQKLPDHIRFTDFGTLEFEKYASLLRGETAKRTWFFRLTLFSDTTANKERFLFFFGFASSQIRAHAGRNLVTLHTALEVYPSQYERLSELSYPDLPAIREIAYLPEKESFLVLNRSGELVEVKAEDIAVKFIEDAFKTLRSPRSR